MTNLDRLSPEQHDEWRFAMAELYTKPQRPFAKLAPEAERRLRSEFEELFEQSQLAYLRADHRVRLERPKPSRPLGPYFTEFFENFDVDLTAQIYRLADTGTYITKEAVASLISHPFESKDILVCRIAERFAEDYLSRTCDLGYGHTRAHELERIQPAHWPQFRCVVEQVVFRVRYSTHSRGKNGDWTDQQYLTRRGGRLRWLDLSDDAGLFADLNWIRII